MEFITLPDEKQNSILSEDLSCDLGDSPKGEAMSSNSQTETAASDNSDVMSPDKGKIPHGPGRWRILQTGKRGHPRKDYRQVSIVLCCFETSPIVQKALVGPNKVA
ncbi:hypothetical protein NPIL_630621 [Nephila pilipes]|uniref:Uncharacterized protein n=1 Tax=Nephila pilipes TaxID=299642 RepID=A0A8X6UD99_NEPPI|nr:hypothetical protein NPIL_630621 [Nephila pilipes]